MDSVADFRSFIDMRQWRFAKTMPQWPHEYTVRRYEDPQHDQALFEQAVIFIRTNGYRAKFPETGNTFTYLDVDRRQ
jgi:hypothetical protein